jgi:hypothetical protein
MAMIYYTGPDGKRHTRRATKADDDRFYKAMSEGIDKGGLVIHRQAPPPSQPPKAKPRQDRAR